MAWEASLTVEGLPPSGNHYKKPNARGGFIQWYLTPEAKQYKLKVAALTAPISGFPATDPIRLGIRIYSDNAARDLDNFLKVLFDALQRDDKHIGYGGVYVNDKQVVGLDYVELEYDYDRPRIEVAIRGGPEYAKKRSTRGRTARPKNTPADSAPPPHVSTPEPERPPTPTHGRWRLPRPDARAQV